MPGIVGLVTKMPHERAEQELVRMVKSIHHETFYATGMWMDQALGVYVGWAVQKNSFSDGMPLRDERGNIILVFSGEEYPEPGRARRRPEQQYPLEAEGPAYLLQSYVEDPRFPVGLNGKFHGVVVDRARGTAMLFNDRYGMHRICYHEAKQSFYFAAEAKAILAVCPQLRVADTRGLAEFVAYSCILDNRTMFRDIHVLPQASAWTFRNGSIEQKRTYFQPCEWEEQAALEPESYYEELRGIFSRNLPRYFNGRERIGMTLTGGLDTRMIMAWRKPSPGALPCYTFGGMLRDCQDVRVARQVASLCQQSHQVIRVGAEFLTSFPDYAERSAYLTEGTVDVRRCTDLYVSEKVRELAPVKVVGTYGSEILRQAVTLTFVAPPLGLYRPEFLAHVDDAGQHFAALRSQHPVTFAAFRQSPWQHYGVLALEQSQLSVRSPFLDNDFVRTAFRAPKSNGWNEDVRLRLIRDGNPALDQIRTDRGAGGNSGPLAQTAARGFQEFMFKAEYVYDYGMPQWLTRVDHLLAPLHLERLFLGRHTSSYFRIWYRDALSKYVREILLDSRTLSRPYLERSGVETVVQGHLKGHRNYTREIHKMLTLELLHRLFLDAR